MAWAVAWEEWAAWATWACNFSAKRAAGGVANPGRAEALSVGFAPCQRRVARKNPLASIQVEEQPKQKPAGREPCGFFSMGENGVLEATKNHELQELS